jgi:hypothetical protein
MVIIIICSIITITNMGSEGDVWSKEGGNNGGGIGENSIMRAS